MSYRVCAKCERSQPLTLDFWYKSHIQRNTGYCKECQDKYRKTRDNILRKEVVAAYGNKCNCCEENMFMLLTIDHINNDGNLHRKKDKKKDRRLWSFLKTSGYPSGYQVLCWNCNIGKHLNGGVCPHKTS